MKPVKFTSTVSGASLLIATFAIASKGLGFLREVIFASIYGLSVEFDIYLIGAVIPLTINTIILCIGQNYFVPVLNKTTKENPQKSLSFVRSNILFFFIGGVFISLLLFLTAESILAVFIKDTNVKNFNNTLNVYLLFLLTIPITAIISLIIGYFQARSEFKYSVSSSIIPNIIVLLVVYFWGNHNILAIPVGFVIGNFIQLVYLILASKEIISTHTSGKFYGKFFYSSNVLSILIIVSIEIIGQLYAISDRYFYNLVSVGAISALNYAYTIFLLPISILSISLTTALFPKFSKLFNEGKIDELEKVFNHGMIVSVGIFIPIMILFIVYGNTLLGLVFERGNFSTNETRITSQVLSYYSLGIVFYAVYAVINKLFYSSSMLKSLFYISVVGIIVKVMINFILVNLMAQNGLALGTTISYTFFFLVSITTIRKKLRFKSRIKFSSTFLFYLLNGIFSMLVAFILSDTLLVQKLLGVFVFVIVYSINLIILKSSLLQILKTTFIQNIIPNFKEGY